VDGDQPVMGTTLFVPPPAFGAQTHTLQYYSVDNALNTEAAKPTPPVSFIVSRPMGTIRFAWDNPAGDSNAEVWVRDSAGHLVYHGSSTAWDAGWFTVNVPVSPRPYSLESQWYDDSSETYGHTYGLALIDISGAIVTWWY
jgi:hypothetical protein